MVTLQWLIRQYANNVLTGTSDADLTPRVRRYCGVALNIASNATQAVVAYPPTDATRDDIVRRLLDRTQDVMSFLSPAQATDFGNGMDRAITILRNI